MVRTHSDTGGVTLVVCEWFGGSMEHGRGNGVCMPVQSDTFACAIRHLHNLLSGYPFVILSGSASTRVTANQGSKLQAC